MGNRDLKGSRTHYQLPIPWAIRFPSRKASDEFALQIENSLTTAMSPKMFTLVLPRPALTCARFQFRDSTRVPSVSSPRVKQDVKFPGIACAQILACVRSSSVKPEIELWTRPWLAHTYVTYIYSNYRYLGNHPIHYVLWYVRKLRFSLDRSPLRTPLRMDSTII